MFLRQIAVLLALAVPFLLVGCLHSPGGGRLPPAWQIVPEPIGDAPLLRFGFPPPLEHYGGTASSLRGELRLGAGGVLAGSSGYVEVAASELDMGEKYLTMTMLDELLAAENPVARFDLREVSGVDASLPLRPGEERAFAARGDFSMKGITIPADVAATVLPTTGPDGQPRLVARVTFAVRLKESFNIDGPVGPLPARDTVEFALVFPMVPSP